jgi:integrase
VQRQRSTKETNRAKAQFLAEKFESTYTIKLTEAQARKVVSDIYAEVHGQALYQSTTRQFMADWLKNKRVETTNGTHSRYTNAVDKLLAFLGDRADKDIAYVHKRDLGALRDKTATELSPSTANTDLKILRVAFRQSVADGLRLDNPAAAIKALKERRGEDETERRPFTVVELKKLLKVAEGEWRGLILAGLYTGQRLGDLASMTWHMVDLKEDLITFRTRKMNRIVVLPIAGALKGYLAKLGEHQGSDPVFPLAHQERLDAKGESRRLSAQFHALLVKAGLMAKRTKLNTGRGHSTQRRTSELSFHCLRHTATSWLKRAGVPESVVRDIVGHESEMVSRDYTHVDDASKRAALKKLPSL